MPTQTERVIALDPGGRTGWAAADMSEDRLELLGTGVLRQDMMARWLADAQAIAYAGMDQPAKYVVARKRYDVIVSESWKPRRKNGSMDWIEGDPLLSAQHVGQIRLIADLSHARYVEYAPSQKHVFTASMPAALLALNDLSTEQHDQDARMHLWGYFMENWFTATGEPELIIP